MILVVIRRLIQASELATASLACSPGILGKEAILTRITKIFTEINYKTFIAETTQNECSVRASDMKRVCVDLRIWSRHQKPESFAREPPAARGRRRQRATSATRSLHTPPN